MKNGNKIDERIMRANDDGTTDNYEVKNKSDPPAAALVRRATLEDALQFATRQVCIFRISRDVGDSMRPTFAPNDVAIVDRAAYRPHMRSISTAPPIISGVRFAAALLESILGFVFGDGYSKTDINSALSIMPSVGDIVVCRHPSVKNTFIIKRVGQIDGTTLTLYGDNHMDGESNQGDGLFGTASSHLVVGKVVARVASSS